MVVWIKSDQLYIIIVILNREKKKSFGGIFRADMSKGHGCPLAKWLKNIGYAVEDPAETCQQNITMVHCK